MLNVTDVMRDLRDEDPQDLLDVLERAARPLGRDVVLYLVDFQQLVLQAVPLLSRPQVVVEENVATSLAGRAFTTGVPVSAERPEGTRVWVPVYEHSMRSGVLAVTVDDASDETLAMCSGLGVLAGLLVASAARYTDLIHARRRGREMTLAASMQWDLLPPPTLRTPNARVTGALEPAYEVAGDGFDFAVNLDRLDVAVFDGMGHGISSSLLTTLAVGAYRHARRNGEDVAALHVAVDDAVTRQYDGDAFVTGVLARLDLRSGTLTQTLAGHPAPLLLRNRKVVGELGGDPMPPFGLGLGRNQLRVDALEPGDQVLLYTDGVVEARATDGSEFGLGRLGDLLERSAAAEATPEETLRRLIRSVLEHQAGSLRDDATLVLLQWDGPFAPTDERPDLLDQVEVPSQDGPPF